jgi:hypothetical protein
MRRRRNDSAETGSVSRTPRIIDYGRYPIPVLEQTYGLTSQDNVVFRQSRDRLWELLALTFDSIRRSHQPPKAQVSVESSPTYSTPADSVTAGATPAYRSLLFAEQVVEAITRCLPRATVVPPPDPTLADFQVSYEDRPLLVEIKWRADLTQPFAASTLSRVMDRIGAEDKLLVVVDAVMSSGSPRPSDVNEGIGDRSKIVGWQNKEDDRALCDAIKSLLGVSQKAGLSADDQTPS